MTMQDAPTGQSAPAEGFKETPAGPRAGQAMLLSNETAGPGARRLAGAALALSAACFCVLAPFARLALTPLPAFIPIYESALVVTDAITVVILLGQRQAARSDALALLAGGYLFTALMAVAHALTFPGLFAPQGLLGAGPQTTAWLYALWHGGFPLYVLAYAVAPAGQLPRRAAVVPAMSAATIALVLGAVLLATRAQGALPALMQSNSYAPAEPVVFAAIWIVNLVALMALARRRPHSMLDLWLCVTMCAWLFDIALSAGLDAGRYDLGFYAGRIYGLLAASFVLVVLLVQNGRLYLQLIALRDSDRDRAEELRRLNTLDPLTGIANRRAFEEALGQEWRRMMRHASPLSLLLIDVDYFKRFNDCYGHVAGDRCLRQVAQLIARRARRAGELAARYGGEEFAVLLPHTPLAAAQNLAELMCAAVREACIAHEASDVAPWVTISVGAAAIAEVPPAGIGLSRDGAAWPAAAAVLVEAADQALYAAKLAGRNRAVAAGGEGPPPTPPAPRVTPARVHAERA